MPKRRRLLAETKLEILKAADNGCKQRDIAAHYAIAPSTVSVLLSQRAKKLEEHSQPTSDDPEFNDEEIPEYEEGEEPQFGSRSVGRKHVRSAILHDVEKALLKWLKHARTRNIGLSGALLKEKAERFAALLGHDEFRASPGWMERFKTKHDVPFMVPSCRRTSADHNSPKEWRDHMLPKLLAKYDPNDVFVAEETGLFYRMTPIEANNFSGGNCSGGQRSKDRLSVLLCSNLDDSERRKLWVIGQSVNPSSLREVRSSPARYRSDPSAWMTGEIHFDWLRDFNDAMRAERRRVLLLVDNSTCHDHEDLSRMDSIRVEFYPSEYNAVPYIGCHLKRLYRRRLLQRMIVDRQRKTETRVTVKEAMDMLAASWKRVEQREIEKWFRRAGFLYQPDEEEEEGDEIETSEVKRSGDDVTEIESRLWSVARDRLNIVPELMTVIDYFAVDIRLATSALFTDEEIVASVIGGGFTDCLDASDPESDEEGSRGAVSTSTAPQPASVTVSFALSAINDLRMYLQSRKNVPCDLLDNVSGVEDCVLRSVVQ